MSLSIKPSIVKDGFGKKLCSYLVALEGYRRGLELEIFDAKFIKFSLTSSKRTLHFDKSRIDSKVTKEAIEIVKDKEKTKQYLKKRDIPVPEGKFFDKNNSEEEIIKYGEKLGFPLVVKPHNSSLGKGVVSNIQNITELQKAIIYVRQELNRKDIILEKYIKGEDYRVYVIKGHVAGVIQRIPANVLGNGKDTIETLIEKKNQIRKKNPYLSKGLIKLDHEVMNCIKKKGYILSSILEENKLLYLREKANASAGADTINITESFPESAKRIAIQATKAIPNLYNAGVDIILDAKNKNDKGTVIELNSRAQIGLHAYPSEGESINIAKSIIDTYFPETLVEETYVIKRNNLTFNLKSALKPLIEGSASSVKIKPAPTGKIIARKVEVVGEVDSIKFKRWVRKKAIALKISGNIKKIDNNRAKIIVAGKSSSINQLKEDLKDSQFSIEEMNEEVYKGIIRVGFQIM